MTARIFFIVLAVLAGNVQAATYSYYSSPTAANSACVAANTTCGSNGSGYSNQCSASATNHAGGGLHYEYTKAGTGLYYRGCYYGWATNCSITGQTYNSQGVCECPAGQIVQGSACAAPPVQDCPKDQYRATGGGACQAVPDCNASAPVGGNFFNVSTLSCQTVSPAVVCIAKDSNGVGGGAGKWCPPIQDCISTGVLCTDNQANVDDANATRQAVIDANKAKADAAAAAAAQAKTDAAAAAAAKQAAADASAADAARQQAAAAAAAQAGTASAAAIKAAQAAAEAVARQAADAIAAANSAAQKAIADVQEAMAREADRVINNPGSPGAPGVVGPNMSDDLGKQADEAAKKAKAAGIGAAGGYAPDGQPSAGDGGPGTGKTCPDCAKEATLQKTNEAITKLNTDTNGKLDKLHDDLNTKDPGAMATIGDKDSVRSFGDSTNLVINKFKSHMPIIQAGLGYADCPVFTRVIPFLNVELTIDQHCMMGPTIAPILQTAMTVVWSIMGYFIIFGA